MSCPPSSHGRPGCRITRCSSRRRLPRSASPSVRPASAPSWARRPPVRRPRLTPAVVRIYGLYTGRGPGRGHLPVVRLPGRNRRSGSSWPVTRSPRWPWSPPSWPAPRPSWSSVTPPAAPSSRPSPTPATFWAPARPAIGPTAPSIRDALEPGFHGVPAAPVLRIVMLMCQCAPGTPGSCRTASYASSQPARRTPALRQAAKPPQPSHPVRHKPHAPLPPHSHHRQFRESGALRQRIRRDSLSRNLERLSFGRPRDCPASARIWQIVVHR